MVDAVPALRGTGQAVTVRDAVVVGGGPAGATLAQALAAAGRDVVLVEREAGPHDKVCGEFLSQEAIHYLRLSGLEPGRLGAVPIAEVDVSAGGKRVTCPLPFTAYSLSRRRMDEALIELARGAGSRILRGRSVQGLERCGGFWTARLDDGDTIRAQDAFVATGKHDLRGWKRPPGSQNDLIGLKLHLRLAAGQAAELAGKVELFLFPGGYAGLEPIEAGKVNLCLLIRKDTFRRIGQKWPALLDLIQVFDPHFARRMEGAVPLRDRPLAIANIPYGLVERREDGCWRLGDQAAVIPSFAGEGMSIALHSAALAANCYLHGGTAAEFTRRLRNDLSGQVGRATLLSHLLVQRKAQAALALGARLWPAALGLIASATRIQAAALRTLPVALPDQRRAVPVAPQATAP
ncbi:NAD(P)/FAD-dependent oxidoreductase [Geminicoccus flavidas]|uniref:NAD(P)/FAD-dependent oxidoreductase n=1 Tax=Geminicoccus flavidas TaxID=2506407 RepID=UPI00190F3374